MLKIKDEERTTRYVKKVIKAVMLDIKIINSNIIKMDKEEFKI